MDPAPDARPDHQPDNRRRLLVALVAGLALLAVLIALQLVD